MNIMQDEELRVLARRIDKELDVLCDEPSVSGRNLGAVNWGDLKVVFIERRFPIYVCGAQEGEEPYIAIVIEEADPSCSLGSLLRDRLGIPSDVVIECEW